jgi:hypothetical protein
MFSRLRRDCDTRPLRCRSMAPDVGKAKTPAIGLSELNSMAFGLAVYASQCGLPTPHARLAPGRWSGATGRAFTRKVPTKGFEVASLHLVPLSQASWRNPTHRCTTQRPVRGDSARIGTCPSFRVVQRVSASALRSDPCTRRASSGFSIRSVSQSAAARRASNRPRA